SLRQFNGLDNQPLGFAAAIVPGEAECGSQEQCQGNPNPPATHCQTVATPVRFPAPAQLHRHACVAPSRSIAGAAMTIDQDDLSHAEMAALATRIDRPIALVGMMGVGKSTVGRRLAALLELPFADADDEIEEAAQLSVSEVFER